MNLLRTWKSSQTDSQRLVSNFLAKLEEGEKKAGTTSMHNLILKVKETIPTGKLFAKGIEK